MSAYTTLFITRSKAKEVYLKSLPVAVTDEILKEFMDKLLNNRLYNAIIVDDDHHENDDFVV